MNAKPLGNRVVVRRIEDDAEKTSSGLYIPDSAKEKPQMGEIVAAGPGTRKDDGDLLPMDVKAGDKVMFGKYAGNDITVDGEELMIMREDEILGVLDD